MASEAPDYFVPESGAVLTHLLIVGDVDRSREFYQRVLGADVIRERQPCVLHFHNSYIVINNEGGPTDDKPEVQAQAPPNPNTLSSAMNIRVRTFTRCTRNGGPGVVSSSPNRKTMGRRSAVTCGIPMVT